MYIKFRRQVSQVALNKYLYLTLDSIYQNVYLKGVNVLFQTYIFIHKRTTYIKTSNKLCMICLREI